MTTKRLVSIAREVWGESAILPFDALDRFAKLVRNATLEEAASLCECLWPDGKRSGHEWSDGWADGTCASADAIRDMKETNA